MTTKITKNLIADGAVGETQIDSVFNNKLVKNDAPQTLNLNSTGPVLSINNSGTGPAIRCEDRVIVTNGASWTDDNNYLLQVVGASNVRQLIKSTTAGAVLYLDAADGQNPVVTFYEGGGFRGRMYYGIQGGEQAIWTEGTTSGNGFGVRSSDGRTIEVQAYNITTASSANLVVSSTGLKARSTSSLKFKTDLEPMWQTVADELVTKLEPFYYRSLGSEDNEDHSFYGLAAEQVAAIDPRLAQWGYLENDYEYVDIADGTSDDGIPLTRKDRRLKADAQLRPVGVMYDRLVLALLMSHRKHVLGIEGPSATSPGTFSPEMQQMIVDSTSD